MARNADVAITGDRITFVGDAGRANITARRTIDARGLIVAPGFIDPHTHALEDLSSNDPKRRANLDYLMQGVTTVITGNDGGGPYEVARTLEKWRTDGIGSNGALLVGYGSVRQAVMRMSDARAVGAQLDSMRALVDKGMREGALGMSTGLYYAPQSFSTIEEVIEMAKVAAKHGGIYDSHLRDESSYTIGLLAAVREALRIGKEAGMPVNISHIKALGVDVWGRSDSAIAIVEAARAAGAKVTADQYPYTAGSTILSAVFRDGKLRGLVGDVLGSDVVVASSAKHPEWEGRSLAALADEMKGTAEEAATRVLAEDPAVTVILHVMREEDVRTVMRHPSTMIGSDGIPTLKGKPHPRLYGTFARVLGYYARDEKLFSQAEAVHRMTGFSARKFGLRDRGVVKAGAIADLVLFDPRRIIDRGTFEDPHRTPDGIEAVYVNGVKAVAGGKPTGARAGRVLRRGT